MARLSVNAIIARKALDISVNEPELAKEVANVFDRDALVSGSIEEILGWMKGWKLE